MINILAEFRDFQIVYSPLGFGNGHYRRSKKLYDYFSDLGFSGNLVCTDDLTRGGASVTFIDVVPSCYEDTLELVGLEAITINNFPGFTGLTKIHIRPSFSDDNVTVDSGVVIKDGLGWQVPNFDGLSYNHDDKMNIEKNKKKRVLVYLGAADPNGFISEKLREYFVDEGFIVDVIKFGNVMPTEDYFSIMLRAHFVIINGGQSRLDVLQTRRPFAYLSLHEGQREISKSAAEAFGFGLDFGLVSDLTIGKCRDANLVRLLAETVVPSKMIDLQWKKNYAELLNECLV